MRIFWPSKLTNVELQEKANTDDIKNITDKTKMAMDRTCSKKTSKHH
jgi:hypothetical protein